MEKMVVFTNEELISKIEAQQMDGESFSEAVQRLCEKALSLKVYGGEYIK